MFFTIHLSIYPRLHYISPHCICTLTHLHTSILIFIHIHIVYSSQPFIPSSMHTLTFPFISNYTYTRSLTHLLTHSLNYPPSPHHPIIPSSHHPHTHTLTRSHIQTHTHTPTHTHTQTQTHTHTHTHTYAYTHTHIHT